MGIEMIEVMGIEPDWCKWANGDWYDWLNWNIFDEGGKGFIYFGHLILLLFSV